MAEETMDSHAKNSQQKNGGKRRTATGGRKPWGASVLELSDAGRTSIQPSAAGRISQRWRCWHRWRVVDALAGGTLERRLACAAGLDLSGLGESFNLPQF